MRPHLLHQPGGPLVVGHKSTTTNESLAEGGRGWQANWGRGTGAPARPQFTCAWAREPPSRER